MDVVGVERCLVFAGGASGSDHSSFRKSDHSSTTAIDGTLRVVLRDRRFSLSTGPQISHHSDFRVLYRLFVLPVGDGSSSGLSKRLQGGDDDGLGIGDDGRLNGRIC